MAEVESMVPAEQRIIKFGINDWTRGLVWINRDVSTRLEFNNVRAQPGLRT
jgi:hypothetical protein